MRLRLILFVLPLLLMQTVSYGQRSEDSCYTAEERKILATLIVEGEMCDSLLSICDEQVLMMSDLVSLNESQIQSFRAGLEVKDAMLMLQAKDIETYKGKIKIMRRNNFVVYGGIAAGVVALILLK